MDTPTRNGLDLARLIRQDPAFLDWPMLVLSDDPDPAERRHAVVVGVDDLLAPPGTPADLALAVTMRVGRARCAAWSCATA